MSKTVLVVGGAGYIGSHIAKALYERGDTPITILILSLFGINSENGFSPHQIH
ncbi:NAD-dependent epimerase/dehydratase family protein [Woodsholea maritima]|uniref:NAD-dependent epimerase/dehydratase family protein n=1 Tax=Woodsholea maritima TaxID=240237 RepID=UPI000361D19E|nr:NAD-dependent epimerase/dehydratase family protein [Woodsholea maritima]